VEEACRIKKDELFGHVTNVSHIVESASEGYLERMMNSFVSKRRDGSTVGTVVRQQRTGDSKDFILQR